ncbi:glycosyltransferase family 4 protein [Thermococcus litoralis]|uniref:glycosyltransferase family 4 protein n=1 Tax=Thermococcus litoralis TaxID=2265 RepID=UPI000B35133E|nr:glycosyltransferase family 4 protein [Thermococcus litoralis]
MKLLLINYMETTAPGGINKVVFEIARWLSKWGHEVIVFNPAWDDKLQMREEEVENFRLIRGYKYRESLYGFDIKNMHAIKEVTQKFNPDIIHVHGYHTLFSPEIVWAVRKANKNVPIVFTPHYDPLNHSTLAGKLFGDIYDVTFGRLFLRKVTHIVSVSNFEANNLKRIHKIPEEKITVIPHGVDFIDTKKKRKRNGNKHITLLYVGYLLEYKGVHHIIKALRELVYSLNFRDVTLKVIGEGPEKTNLISLSKKLKVYEFIEWTPFLPHEEVLKEMKQADVFLLLSKSEGYGIVVAEALAMGTPAIVTKGTALEEFTKEPGCFGVNYPPNPREVAELILKIANSNVKVGPFSKKIRTWDEVVRGYEKVYTSFIE